MGIDMSSYKMIYKDIVFSVVTVMPFMESETVDSPLKVKRIEVIFVNEDGELGVIEDERSAFKFVRR